jgi:ketosteroid isomerase-like protein
MQQAQVETWLQTWDGPIRIDRHDADLTIDGALAVQTAVIRMRGRQGGDDRDLWFRATSCLRRRAHRWRIAHEHTSVPFYMDGSDRAALDLEP